MSESAALTPGRRAIIRGFAWLDFAVTLPFALPFVSDAAIGLVYRLDAALGFSTVPVGFGPMQMMFVNIMGVLGVVWAAARLREPSETLARFDGLGRIMVAALILHAINLGASPVLAGFIVTELTGSVAQLLGRRSA